MDMANPTVKVAKERVSVANTTMDTTKATMNEKMASANVASVRMNMGDREMNVNLDEIKRRMEEMLSAERYEHSIRTAEEAARLAKRYGADESKAYLAGVIHDCAKDLEEAALLKMAGKYGIVIDEITRLEPELLHGLVGARYAEEELGITDPEILEAVACHTLGAVGMSTLSKIIYIADYTEPGRSFNGVEALRKAADEDLDKAIVVACDHTLKYLADRGKMIHPAIISVRNAALRAYREKMYKP